MILETIFAFSGLFVALLIVGKIWEGKSKRSFILLKGISKGDERVRVMSHQAAFRYSDLKDNAFLFVTKQIPLQSKNLSNKANTAMKERTETFLATIRDSRFLRKNDGISEFFKSISEKENDGRIDESLDDSHLQ